MAWWSGLSAATQGGLISAGGSLLSGLLSQRSANKQIQAQADSSRDQYQRAVADMKAAGLNPMLATKLGGNAAISGAMASFPDIGQAVTRGAQAELSVAQADTTRAEAQLKNIDAEIKRLKDLPASMVSGFKDRLVSKLVNTIEDYIDAANPAGVGVMDNSVIKQMETTMSNARRASTDVFIRVLGSLNKGSLKFLEGLDWFDELVKGL